MSIYANKLRKDEFSNHAGNWQATMLGSQKVSVYKFQATKPATAKDQRPNTERRQRGTNSQWKTVDHAHILLWRY